MTLDLSGRVALVTGGGSGIGRATVLTFARQGARVVVADIAVKGGKETVRLVEDAGGEAVFIEADVSKAAQVKSLVTKTVETYGRLDCAHNNAAANKGPNVPTHEVTEEEWDRIIGMDLKSIFLSMKHEIPQMLAQGGGAIVNTASINGLVAGRNDAPYAAGKHGVVGLTRTAAVEYAKFGIRVNCVCPGWIDTPRTARLETMVGDGDIDGIESYPIGRKGLPQEIAEAVVWLCSDAASYVTGHTMTVDGGYVAQ